MRYATLVKDDCFERFYRFHEYCEGETLRLYEKYCGVLPSDSPRVKEVKDKYNVVKNMYKNKPWTKSFRQMCIGIDECPSSNDLIVGMAIGLYESVYRELSYYVHNNPSRWDQRVNENVMSDILNLINHTIYIAFRVFQMIAVEYNVVLSIPNFYEQQS